MKSTAVAKVIRSEDLEFKPGDYVLAGSTGKRPYKKRPMINLLPRVYRLVLIQHSHQG